MSSPRIVRWVRRAPLAGEALIAYARARRRIAREHDARKLVAATRRSAGAGVGAGAGRPLDARPERLPEARRLARGVARTLALLPMDARCMVRSLVLIDVLARRRIGATLVIGARRDPAFRAHAWVELGGEPLLSPGDYAGSRLAEL